jgi:hypothetical protein
MCRVRFDPGFVQMRLFLAGGGFLLCSAVKPVKPIFHNVRLAKVHPLLGKSSGLFFTDCVDKAILIEFSGALVRLTRYDVGGTSISAKATIDELTRRPLLLNYFRFRGIADMAGLAAGSTQSRLT